MSDNAKTINSDLEERRKGVRYRELHRDPKQVREKFILELLLDRPHTADQIRAKAANNDLGYSPNTYVTDLRGLVRRNLVLEPGTRSGNYMLHPLNGLPYCQHKGYA